MSLFRKMGTLAICIVLCLAVSQVAALSCQADSGCPETDCCVSYLFYKRCVRKGEQEGVACGGSYRCSDCLPPFKCFPHERTFINLLKIGTGKCHLDR